MFTIGKTEGTYTEYAITNEADASCLKVVPEKGGIITGLSVKGREALYVDRELLGSGSDIHAGGLPILFPICGGFRDDFFQEEGFHCNLPEHGFAKSSRWAVKQISAQTGEIILELTDNDSTFELYPFHFRCTASYQLCGNELRLSFEVTNCGDGVMPFYLGIHPFFNIQNKNGMKFVIDADAYIDYHDGLRKAYAGTVDFSKPVDFVFNLNPSPEYHYQMAEANDGRKIAITTSGEYGYMVLWTQEGKSFVCMESWMSATDATHTDKGMLRLRPNESAQSWIRIRLGD
ncbi:MAG: hypothetical protein P4M02_11795 [Clostridia bacterium]|nr:hypothetical protein [Clostridia bacterium]